MYYRRDHDSPSNMFSEESIQRLVIYLVPMLLGIICHEVAHGYVAWRLGDPTAKSLGRLTLNPLPHIDGTGLLVFVCTAMFAPFTIGWAKPVPVNCGYFKHPIRHMAIVALAGPVTNFILALLCAILMLIITSIPELFTYILTDATAVWKILQAGVWINILLGWFNLIPIPPLDGSKILAGLLPRQISETYLKISRFGLIILIVLMATGIFWKILSPLITGTLVYIIQIFNIPFWPNWL